MTVIYYFTRTGDSEKIARDMAAQTSGEVRQITDNKNWKGILGFIKGGYYASSQKKLPTSYVKPDTNDVIYLCFPVWAGSFPPAVRNFIDEIGRENIIAVASSGGGGLKDKEGFVKVIQVDGKDKSVRI